MNRLYYTNILTKPIMMRSFVLMIDIQIIAIKNVVLFLSLYIIKLIIKICQ